MKKYNVTVTALDGETVQLSHRQFNLIEAEKYGQSLVDQGGYRSYQLHEETGLVKHAEYKGYHLCSQEGRDSKGFPAPEFGICDENDRVLIRNTQNVSSEDTPVQYVNWFHRVVDHYSSENDIHEQDMDLPEQMMSFVGRGKKGGGYIMKVGNGSETLFWGETKNPLTGRKIYLWNAFTAGGDVPITSKATLFKRYNKGQAVFNETAEVRGRNLLNIFRQGIIDGAKEQALQKISNEKVDDYKSKIGLAGSLKEVIEILKDAQYMGHLSESAMIREGLASDARRVEADNEVQMARGELYHIAQDAIQLHQHLGTIDPDTDLEYWVTSKITQAKTHLSSVADYMEYQSAETQLPTEDPVLSGTFESSKRSIKENDENKSQMTEDGTRRRYLNGKRLHKDRPLVVQYKKNNQVGTTGKSSNKGVAESTDRNKGVIKAFVNAKRLAGWSVYSSRINDNQLRLEFDRDGMEFEINGRGGRWELFSKGPTLSGQGEMFSSLDDAFETAVSTNENTAGAVAGVAMPLGKTRKRANMFENDRDRAENLLRKLLDEYNAIMAGMSDRDEGEVTDEIEKICDEYDLDPEDYLNETKKKRVNEDTERTYVAVHAKKGKTEVTGSSSYDAAKKAAAKWKLKSTAGIDVHVTDRPISTASL